MPLGRILRTFPSLPLTQVSVRDSNGSPARIYADVSGRLPLSDVGRAITSSTGVLDIWVDDSSTYTLKLVANGVVLEKIHGLDPDSGNSPALVLEDGKSQDVSARLANPVLQSSLWPQTLAETSESITVVQGPSVATGAQITTEYNALRSGRREIAFRTDAERAANLGVLRRITYGVTAPTGVAQFATQLGTDPTISSGVITGWNRRGGIALRLIGDEITLVYGDNTSTNSAKILVDGRRLAGSDAAGFISQGISSTNHTPQWTRLTFSDRRRRTIVADRATIQAVIVKFQDQIEPYPFTGKAIVFGDSHGNRSLTTGESAPVLRNGGLWTGALEALGYQVCNLSLGGTGFVNNGSILNYSGLMALWATAPTALPSEYQLVVLMGTGNDRSFNPTQAQYRAVIDQALATFPNAKIIVPSVYEGFNTPADAAWLNERLKPAALQGPADRVIWLPIDAPNHPDGLSMWFGTGRVGATTNDGNADWALGAISAGTDRHANAIGLAYGADFLASELLRTPLPFARRPL